MSKIIEITSLKQLFELSSMGGGSVAGYAAPLRPEDDKMKREDIVTEQKLRTYIRNKINESYKRQKTQQLNEEAKLRQIIRSILKAVTSAVNVPIWVKLTPSTAKLVDAAGAAYEAGASSISLCNTFPSLPLMDPETMKSVPRDGKTMGEIMIRGNIVMKGYYKDKEATDKAMKDGWFHSGDLAVIHPDGYVKIQDRSKDIIITGGENVSSIEIENTLAKHPSVSIAAVVSKPDEKWGEVPCAFIETVKDKPVTEKELISFCKETLASFKVPKKIEFCELPKTSTGKIQKFELRKKAKEIN